MLNVRFSVTEPSKLSYLDTRKQETLPFYPDCIEDLVGAGNGQELTALLVISTKDSSPNALLHFQGLVLRSKQTAVDTSIEFERVGIFHAYRAANRGASQWLEIWEKGSFRIV